MTIIVVTPPSPFIDWEIAKLHLRLDTGDFEKAYVEGLLAAAVQHIDGPDGWLGRCLGVQELEIRLCQWPCAGFEFPFPPFIEITSITYIDPQGVEHSLPVPMDNDFSGAPDVRGKPGDVRIRYRAGYGRLGAAEPPVWENTVPKPIEVAVLMMAAQWYATREAVTLDGQGFEMPLGVSALLQPYRVYR